MSKSLALLSGKGGSGKTSLALSIASLLAKCNLKVLLVDCDLSTNGATYFFEDRINEKSDKLVSFFRIFDLLDTNALSLDTLSDNNRSIKNYYTRSKEKGSVFTISENLDFLPSIIDLSARHAKTYNYKYHDKEIMNYLNSVWRRSYDVIIYDCEAGYSEILKTILPFVDINLLVMEADAISASSVRSLYLKISRFYNGKKFYQVFNKVTKEEYDIYSKVSGGTFFVNIESVMFDWKIRHDFSVGQIPDMKTTSAHYGKQIFNICNVLFKEEEMQESFCKFGKIIELNDITEQEQQTKERLDQLKEEQVIVRSKLFSKYLYLALPILVLLMFFCLFILMGNDMFHNSSLLIAVFSCVFVSILSGIFSIIDFTPSKKGNRTKINNELEKLYTLKEKRESIERSLKKTNS